jgi:Zn-dependent metalloprotease
MLFGDGDGVIVKSGIFTKQVDVIAHELTHGVTKYTTQLEYKDQSGALNESISDVFGIMAKQYILKQTSAQANWLIGEGIFGPGLKASAMRSMKAPGTAYDDPKLKGKDPQPAHMSQFVTTTKDKGGVHINSGIPNRAFYLVAMDLGGNSWDRAGKIWYGTITAGTLPKNAGFKQFADATCAVALKMYGQSVKDDVTKAWKTVGVY